MADSPNLEKRAMTGTGLPPIALEAVLKLLAIGQDNAQARKTAKAVAQPKLQLELAVPAATPFASALRTASPKARATPQRRSSNRNLPQSRPQFEGTKPC